jgi:putative phosphoesterase
VKVGIVADTHDLLDAALPGALAGCSLLLHAGDVTRREVLLGLARVAPVVAVRGNNDDGPFGEALPAWARVELGGIRALVVHETAPGRPARDLAGLLARERPDLVVHGHSHRPGAARAAGVLFLNPGSAGPRRFSLPRTACVLDVAGRRVRASWIDLAAAPPAPWGEPFLAEL